MTPQQAAAAAGSDAVALRTGAEFLRSLDDGRQIFLDGERIESITGHPALRGTVRKTLGRHEIAAVQSIEIDKEAGLIPLNTILAHSSGEWSSSEWPVTPAQPLSAALREQLIAELASISGPDEAAVWAYKSLAAKNTLNEPGAQLVEDGFARRLAEA